MTALLLGLDSAYICERLESYAGSWRRSEIVRTTAHGNTLMSDYGHHPTEIVATLGAIRERYPDRHLLVVFQPHQHSRTRELLDDFRTAFDDAGTLIIPNIYFSRDKEEDVRYMTTERFVDALRERYPSVVNGGGIAETVRYLQAYDATHPDSTIILLLGAGNVDDIRYEHL